MKTRGQEIAEAVRAHLFTNGLKQSQLTGAILAEIADRTLAALDKAAAKRKKLATEDEWLDAMQSDPHMDGVDVRGELAACQFWCKGRSLPCTRKRLQTWLGKAKRDLILSGGGKKQPVRVNGTAPAGWLAKLRELYPDSQYCKGGLHADTQETDYAWSQLAPIIRDELRKAL